MAEDSKLDLLAASCGVAIHFRDWKGHVHHCESATLVSVLAGLGIDASTPAAIDQALHEREQAAWHRALPPCVVQRQDAAETVAVHLRRGEAAELVIELEDGGIRQLVQTGVSADRLIDGVWCSELNFELPLGLPPGYHRLVLHGSTSAAAALIVTPPYLGLPAELSDRQVWGYSVQLYSVTSGSSWGIGDLADLADLAVWAATQQRADYLLINPLHASEPIVPLESSPYYPATRHFLNPIYIRPELIDEYQLLDTNIRAACEHERNSVNERLEESALIDRDQVWTAKLSALRATFDLGLDPIRQMAFDAFRRSEGQELHHFAAWSVLCTQFGRDWHQWAPPYRRPTAPEVAEFCAAHQREVDFAQWLQWIARDQLRRAQRLAKEAGMLIGIVADLAVGVNPAGADPWILADAYAPGVSVGAPPDAYNQLGQDWGQPAWRPDRLAELAYLPFRTIVRSALANVGGVRIDHILGLFRLWWVPTGAGPAQGCYVSYDHEALVGIVALEAYRARAVIIGEDLGTVEPWVHDYLAERGLLGTSVLWFENKAGVPIPPEQWRKLCMASVSTHDLPPTVGYLKLEHVRLRQRLGLLTEPVADELAREVSAQQQWFSYLSATGDLREEDSDDPLEVKVLALYRALGRAPARLLNVLLADAVGESRVQNQVGTTTQYPNWKIPLGDESGRLVRLEDLFALERPMRLAAVLNDWTQTPPPWLPRRGID